MPFHTACKCQQRCRVVLCHLGSVVAMPFHTACKCQLNRVGMHKTQQRMVAMPFHTACKCQRRCTLAPNRDLLSKVAMPFHTACKCQRHPVSFTRCVLLSCNAISHRLQVPTLWTRLCHRHCQRCNAISHRLQVPTLQLFQSQTYPFFLLQCHFTPLASANFNSCPQMNNRMYSCNAISHRLQVLTILL